MRFHYTLMKYIEYYMHFYYRECSYQLMIATKLFTTRQQMSSWAMEECFVLVLTLVTRGGIGNHVSLYRHSKRKTRTVVEALQNERWITDIEYNNMAQELISGCYGSSYRRLS